MTDVARRRSLPLPVAGTFAGIVGTAAAAAGVSWLASGALLRPRRNAGPLPGVLRAATALPSSPPLPRSLADGTAVPGGVSPLGAHRVAVTGAFADRPGTWALRWAGGLGLVDGPVLGHLPDGSWERVVHHLRGAPPVPSDGTGLDVGWDGYVWGDGHPLPGAEAVTIQGPVGPLRGIAVAAIGEPRGCVVHVHGRSALPAQALRLLRACAAAGWDGLATTYRNSDGAPETGRYALGGTEWEDVHVAVEHVLAAGHRRIVLAGCSMGGAIALSFLQRSGHAGAVVGAILDAPVLDWHHVLRSASRNMRAGAALGVLSPLVVHVAAARGAGGARLTLSDSVATLTMPTLILHGADDIVTPVATSEEAGAAAPQITTRVFPGALHATAWNSAPDEYDAAVTAHLASLPDRLPSARPV